MKLKQKSKSEKPGQRLVGKTLVFCPKCKSTDVVRRMAAAAVPNIGALLQINVCQDCGFQDRIFPEIDENDKEILEKIQKIFKKKTKKAKIN